MSILNTKPKYILVAKVLATMIPPSPAIKERPIAKPSLFGRPNIFGPLSMYERLASFLGVSNGSPSDRGAGSS